MMGPSGYRYGMLRNIVIFLLGALIHIFEGELKGAVASGYHYEGIPNTPGKTLPGTAKSPNICGVYLAKVTVWGVSKVNNGGYSSFFPKGMSPQEVVDSINEAYNTRGFVTLSKSTYRGVTSSGMVIEMYLDPSDKIISAFPIY